MTVITGDDVEIDEESKLRAVGDSVKNAATTTTSFVAEGVKATGRKTKSLSKRVAEATVSGSRSVKRAIVKHGKTTIRTAVHAAVALAIVAFYVAMVAVQVLFLMWLFATFPVLFWLAVASYVGVAAHKSYRFATTD